MNSGISQAISHSEITSFEYQENIYQQNIKTVVYDQNYRNFLPLIFVAFPPRGVRGDMWADVIIGQPNFTQDTPNEVVGNKLFNPSGIFVDRSTVPNHVYIYDAGNNRVLGLSHLGTCSAGSKNGADCTSNSDCPGSSCAIQDTRTADIVLGQPNFNTSACNGDSGVQNYPNLPKPNANSMCGVVVDGVSILESGSAVTMDTDNDGNLYIPDVYNHRILRFNDPFNSDSAADSVWGQPDFLSNRCNQGFYQPDDHSLCLAPVPGFGDMKSGIDIDSHGNMWVADTQNNRVLRFPYEPQIGRPASDADLVLGQPNYTSSNPGIDLNQMDSPASVRVSADGTVYVADGSTGYNVQGRVLVFEPPLTIGMYANNTLSGITGEPTGIEIDGSGGIWVNDCWKEKILHFVNGQLQDVINSVPVRSWGGIGIDSDGNIMITGWDSQQVSIYEPPTYGLNEIFLKADEYGSFNHTGSRGLQSGLGLAVTNDQLIYSDWQRLLFWNSPLNLSNFDTADGVIGQPNFNTRPAWDPIYGRMVADGNGRLWVIKGHLFMDTVIQAFTLPLQTGAQPILTITQPIPLLGGGTFSWTSALIIGGIDYQADCDCLWLSDKDNNRVFRIRNVSSPERTVDIVIGQLDNNSTKCNQSRGRDFPTRDSLCSPGALAIDNFGNLYISDHNLEVEGNNRLLEYNKNIIPTTPSVAVFGISATHVFGRNDNFTEPNCIPDQPLCGPFEPAFNSSGMMVVGFNGYLGSRFPLVFQDPTNNQVPVSHLNDFFSQPFSAVYDQFDNLYILDHTRNRILIYWSNK